MDGRTRACSILTLPSSPLLSSPLQAEEVVRGLATLKQGATLRASDIAEAALFLASDDSRYVSGHNLLVDGGVTTARNLSGL
jgi:NAD(P)-dependent dehydrogenase (short-subunit alcohol dehydrogenase family)